MSLAESLSGASSSIPLSWVSPVVLQAPSHIPKEEGIWPCEFEAEEAEEIDAVEQTLDCNVVLEDYFAEDPAISHEDVKDMDLQASTLSLLIPIIWEFPQVRIHAVNLGFEITDYRISPSIPPYLHPPLSIRYPRYQPQFDQH